MSHEEETPFRDSHLESPEYRRRLMRKLNTLIAVLEVARAKVRRSLEGPDADVDRLQRIQKNLGDTMQVCQRAKLALERCEKLPGDLPTELAQAVQETRRLSPARAKRGRQVEMSSPEEAQRFAELPPIAKDEILSCDLDALCDRFGKP